MQYQMYLEYLANTSLLICKKFNSEFEQDGFNSDDDEEIDAIVEKMIEALLECEPGTRTTTARLYYKLFKNNDDGTQFEDMFEVDLRLKLRAKRHGLLLDSSDYNNMIICLPFNVPFTVYKQDNANTNLDCLELVTFEIYGCFTINEKLHIKINQEGKASVNYFKDTFDENETHTFSIKGKLITKLSDAMKDADVCGWNNYYYNLCCDGFTWEMAICDSNYNCILAEGSNGVPKGFDKVFAVLKKIGLESKGPFEPGHVTSGSKNYN